MESFKDFYNGLDILNLILFWGTIIVIILIIIFLTLYFSRKKKVTSDIEVEDNFDDDVIYDDNSYLRKQELFNSDVDITRNDNSNLNMHTIHDDNLDKVNKEINLEDDTIEIPIQKKQVEVDINNQSIDDFKNNDKDISKKENIDVNFEERNIIIEKNRDIEVKKNNDEFLFDELVKKDVSNRETRAYQKNVFREMNSRNQTSPIGIVYEKKDDALDEYKESLLDKKESYLEDVYSNLSKASVPDKVELTEYEKKQEEDAVISYQELIKKKDTIDYDREEDAVISYGELLDRNSRLYNIREEEEDKEFLSELKQFRKDL